MHILSTPEERKTVPILRGHAYFPKMTVKIAKNVVHVTAFSTIYFTNHSIRVNSRTDTRADKVLSGRAEWSDQEVVPHLPVDGRVR